MIYDALAERPTSLSAIRSALAYADRVLLINILTASTHPAGGIYSRHKQYWIESIDQDATERVDRMCRSVAM
jgi:hypothetical protein